MNVLESNNRRAAIAVEKLRRETKASEIPMTKLASELGIDRHTVSDNLRRADISLERFLAISEISGADPLQILKSALHKDVALAAGEVMSDDGDKNS